MNIGKIRQLATRARALQKRHAAAVRAARQQHHQTTEQMRARLRELARIVAARVATGAAPAIDSSPATKRKRAHLREIMRAAAAAARQALAPAAADEPEPTDEAS